SFLKIDVDGERGFDSRGRISIADVDSVEDLEFLDSDVRKFTVNGISVIEFSGRIQQILFKDMEKTVVYKNRILEVVGKLVGKVAELDFNTDSKTRGRFLRMVIFVNIEKLLVSQVLVVGDLIWVEYEALSTICLSCEIYGHLKEMCISPKVEKSLEIGKTNDKSEPANLTS
ncbi:hypothetical protein Goarm_022480, partial [Gossypium armourianum]|nr:hypothetical protein [Gossypium armourianum]